MPSNNENRDAFEMERTLLASLCLSRQDEMIRSQILQFLRVYHWESGDHRAVYDALSGWTVEPAEIRSGLPARLTLMGFPDIDIAPYFEPPANLTDALEWLRQRIGRLQETSCSDPRTNGIHRRG